MGVALSSLAVAALDPLAPAVSLGVVYVLPVLLASVTSGLRLGVGTAVLSMLAFNWFFLAPRSTLTITDGEHWVAIAVLLVVAVVAARITEAARKSADRADAARRDADLLAELATVVLGAAPGVDVATKVEQRLQEHLGSTVRVTRAASPQGGGRPVSLEGREGRVGWLTVGRDLPARARGSMEERFAPALGALFEALGERERYARESIEAAAVRRSDELKTTLLRSVGHDLRTPLTQMTASASALMAGSADDAERRELATGIVEGGSRLTAMVEKLLDLARLEGGSAAPRVSPVALDGVVRDALDGIDAFDRRVRLEVQSPVPEVLVDPVQITRALVNVVENALSHGRGDGPRGDLVLVRITARRGRGVVRVVDRGRGIPAEERERVFEPFERGAGSSGGGSGLGLAIARGFVEANDGQVRIESYPGQGTAVVIELPLAGTEDAATPTAAVPGSDREATS